MEFALILLGLTTLFLGWRYHRIHRLLRELNASIRQRRPYLVEKRFGLQQPGPADELCRNLSRLIETDKRFNDIASQALPQLEIALESLQEAVLIVDKSNRIVVANKSARQMMGGGEGDHRGKRLEQVLRSADFLNCVSSIKSGKALDRREIEVLRGETVTWFEVSGTPIAGLGEDPRDIMTILVLHNITRLKKLEKMRKDFVANVSHELKTPLTIIRGYSETLIEDYGNLPQKDRNRFLTKIMDNVERLNFLIEDLLTLSRLESSPEKLRRIPTHLPTLAQNVIENFKSRLNNDHQEILLECDPGIGDIPLDELRISQAFENLIDNAIRYAGDFSRIEVKIRFSNDRSRVHCSVSDDGVGIPGQDLPHIFERFYRVDKGRSRERGGTGLGLSIVKHIVLLHGGTPRAESASGKGTTIEFTLPVSITPMPPQNLRTHPELTGKGH